jgi:hypothetical protein
MNKRITSIWISCCDNLLEEKPTYSVVVTRKSKRGKKEVNKHYHITAYSSAFDYLSEMANTGKIESHIQLSIYPTFLFTPNGSIK